MKDLKIIKTALILAATLLFPVTLMAASVIVEWAANTEEDIAGYKVYYGTSSGTYPSTFNAGKVTSLQVDSMEAGKTYSMNSLNYMLLPSAKYIYWYVTGEGNGLLVKSTIFRFKKM